MARFTDVGSWVLNVTTLRYTARQKTKRKSDFCNIFGPSWWRFHDSLFSYLARKYKVFYVNFSWTKLRSAKFLKPDDSMSVEMADSLIVGDAGNKLESVCSGLSMCGWKLLGFFWVFDWVLWCLGRNNMDWFVIAWQKFPCLNEYQWLLRSENKHAW